MNFEEEFPSELTLEFGETQITKYNQAILDFLRTGKLTMEPKQYMKTYHCIVKLSDEYGISEDLYRIYKERIENYVREIQRSIQQKAGVPHEFLAEYIKSWEKYTIFVHSMNKVMNYLDRFHLKNAGDQSLT